MTRKHILSALLGSAFAVGIIVLLSMSQVLPAGQHVIVSYGPSPRDMVQFAGTGYVVPPGKLFVLTGLGMQYSGSVGSLTLRINGQQAVSFSLDTTDGNGTSVKTVPPGLAAPAGSSLDITDVTGSTVYATARAWGYLADQ
jgi:hypothetical protein